MEVQLKRVTNNPVNVKILQKIIHQTFINTYQKDTAKSELQTYLDREYNVSQIQKQLDDPNCQFYVCIVDRQVAGYMKLNLGNKQTEAFPTASVEVEKLYIYPEFKRLGLGTKFLKKAERVAKQAEAKMLWIGVWEENEKAIKFYRKLGFKYLKNHEFRLGSEIQRDLILAKRIQ